MKKSQMVRKLVRLLKTWENSKLEAKAAHEILDLLEKNGMLAPLADIKDPGHFPGDEFTYEANEWEPEKSLTKKK